MTDRVTLVYRIVACIGWGSALLRLAPPAWTFPVEAFIFAVAVGMTGTLALIGRALIRPAIEIYEAGRQIGYQQAVAERTSEKLACLDDRRPLRAVKD